MDAVEFLNEKRRMCNSYGPGCDGCPFDGVVTGICSCWCFESPKDAIAIVEQWANEHPRKTRQSEFLKQWPEARIDKSTGILTICPAELTKECRDDREACGAYSVETCVCEPCRREFWMQKVE